MNSSEPYISAVSISVIPSDRPVRIASSTEDGPPITQRTSGLDCPRRQRFAGLIIRFTPTHRRLACSAADAVPGWSARTRLGGRSYHRVQHSRDLKDCDLVRDPAQSMLLGTCLNVARIQ